MWLKWCVVCPDPVKKMIAVVFELLLTRIAGDLCPRPLGMRWEIFFNRLQITLRYLKIPSITVNMWRLVRSPFIDAGYGHWPWLKTYTSAHRFDGFLAWFPNSIKGNKQRYLPLLCSRVPTTVGQGHYKMKHGVDICPSICLSHASTKFENGKAYRKPKTGMMSSSHK